MTPRQALLWFSVAVIIFGILWGIIGYLGFDSVINAVIGGIIAIVGLALIILITTLRWR